eukprot:Skav226283  [mRNA]  locus=scaffold3301:117610:120059:+ [translate_table: standard]
MVRSSFYIDCSPGSMGIPQYEAGVPSWAPPAKCPLDQNPSLVDGGAAKNCRPHQEECRRIHKALESKTLQPSVMFCPLQDMVFIHYNDALALYEKPIPVMEPPSPPDPIPVTKTEKLMAAAKLAALLAKETLGELRSWLLRHFLGHLVLIALEMAAKLGFGGCGKACKADGFVDPPPICLSNPRRRSHCVYMGKPGELFAKKPMVGEAGYKVVELSLPWQLSVACQAYQVELRPVDGKPELQRLRIGAFL